MILGIETATTSCSVSIFDEISKINISTITVIEKNIHSEKLLEFTDTILNESKVKLNQLKKIAVSIGPGSFTGLRIGLSAAKGLALALKIPIVCIPTIDGLIHSAIAEKKINSDKKIIAMIPAKRNEAYFAKYSITDSINRISSYEVKPIIDIFNFNNDSEFLISEEWNLNNVSINEHKTIKVPCTAKSIASLASTKLYAEHNEFEELEPMYLLNFEPKQSKN